MRSIAYGALLLATMSGSALAGPADYPASLPEDQIPNVGALPENWPKSWVLIHDLNFASILDGKLTVVDTTSPARPLKGLVRAAQFANELVMDCTVAAGRAAAMPGSVINGAVNPATTRMSLLNGRNILALCLCH